MRHPATTDIWEWLEHGEGKERTAEEQGRIRATLEHLDQQLNEWDKGWPVPKDDSVQGIPSDYWETAE